MSVNTQEKGQHHYDVQHTYDGITLAVLCVIRDELKTLNRLLHCQNFTDIPQKLDRIDKNTKKAKRKPKGTP